MRVGIGANGRVLMMGAPGVSVMMRRGANAVTVTVAWLGRRVTVLDFRIGGRFWKTNPPVCGVTVVDGSDAVMVVLPLAVAVNSLTPAVVRVHVTAVDPVAVAARARVRRMLAVTVVDPLTAAVRARVRVSVQLTAVLPWTAAVRALTLNRVHVTAVVPLAVAVRVLTPPVVPAYACPK
jgi:hypothetical protein